jgi:REP-associated tyrosine transposase
MTYDPQRHHRRSIRLRGYDYSQAGAYFVTVCAQDRVCLFGEVIGDQMHLNEPGRIVLAEWERLAVRFPTVELDAFVVMPNHIHGILVISAGGTRADAVAPRVDSVVGAGLVPAPRVTTGAAEGKVVGAELGATTRVAPTDILNDLPTTPDDVPTSNAGDVAAPAVDSKPVLGNIVGAFKSLTTDLYIHGVKQLGWPRFRRRLWQRNYHEHIIRSEESLNRIRRYILENPARWATDPENPQAEKKKKK